MRHIRISVLALALCLSVLAACSPPPETAADTGETGVVFTDALDRTVRVCAPQYAAVLSGSLADLWQLAGGEVAVTTRDAFEHDGLTLPDGVVNAGSLKDPDLETILSAGTDFVMLSGAISGHTDLVPALENAGIACAVFDIETFADYLAALEICTDITGRPELFEQNGLAVRARVDAAIARSEGREAPTILLIRAYGTGAKAKNSKNNMTGVMLSDLGCINIADSADALLEDLSMERIIADDPDFIFITTMGSSDEALAALAEGLQANPAWAGLRAVQEGRCIVLPTDLFHNKPNARWGESYEMLADILYGPAQ